MPPDATPLAVSLGGIEPATYAHCAVIRDWLTDLGVDRVTLMVIPAADHHPFFNRSPGLAEWLRERRAAGDGVAQQGFVGTVAAPRDTAEHARAGRRLMARAGLAPSGYLAPSLAHALAARRELTKSYAWWIAPGLWQAGAALQRRRALRIDVRPDDFDRSSARVRALERTLRGEAERRTPVTLDELADTSRLRADPARVRPTV